MGSLSFGPPLFKTKLIFNLLPQSSTVTCYGHCYHGNQLFRVSIWLKIVNGRWNVFVGMELGIKNWKKKNTVSKSSDHSAPAQLTLRNLQIVLTWPLLTRNLDCLLTYQFFLILLLSHSTKLYLLSLPSAKRVKPNFIRITKANWDQSLFLLINSIL